MLLYVSDKLKCVAIDNLNTLKCESLWVKLYEDPGASVTLGVCYRSPTAAEEEITNMFAAITQASKERCLIVGDFNYPTINWKNFECSNEEEKFVELLHDNFMFQYVDEPTREGNILDLVISNEIAMVEELKLLEHFSTSDHNMVEFQLVLKTGVCDAVIYKHDFNRGDYNAIKRALTAINWSETFQDMGVLECYNLLIDKLNELITCHVPVKKFKTKKKCLWLNRNVKKAIKKRNKKWKLYRITKKDADFRRYKECRNLVVKELRKARKKFEHKLALEIKRNPKSFYRYVRSKAKSKERVGPLKDSAGNVIDDDSEMCNMLNSFFASVFTTENIDSIPEVTQVFNGEHSQMLNNIIVTSDDVFNTIMKLKDGKAPGNDGFTTEFLKKLASEISGPLAIIYNKSLLEGLVPHVWKQANVTPLFKKGSKSEPGNYRPVSLTSYIGKILEAILKVNIVRHITVHSLINASQHGFLSRRSCLTNLLEFLEYVTNALEQNKPVDVIYLDFQKAFDKVPHVRLLRKLEAHGIGGNILRWIGEWLTARQQRVVLNGCESAWLYRLYRGQT